MIEMIKIVVKSGLLERFNAVIMYNENLCYVNNKKYSIDDNFKENLIRIIRTWESTNNVKSGIDGEECILNIRTMEGEEEISIKGDFPDNYHQLFKLFEELENE